MTTRHHGVADASQLRSRLTREQGLVRQGLTLHDHAIGWKTLAGQHTDHIVYQHTPNRHTLKTTLCKLALDAVGQAVHQHI